LLVTITAPQLSFAVGDPKITPVAKHEPTFALTVTSTGQVIIGLCVSLTITVCWQVAVFPLLSIAVQMTRLVPIGNCAGALFVTVGVPQLSLTVGLPKVTPLAKHAPAFAFTVTLAGQIMLGGCVSVTVTVNVHTA
jgi:hypothetical protein